MTVLITLHDVEPAVRLNAELEGAGIETALVSPLDDVRAEIKRAKPDLIIVTGDLTDAANIGLLREQLWAGVPCVGLTDGDDPLQRDRLRLLGYVELYSKPIVVRDVALDVRRLMERHALQEATGLIGESEPLREVMVKVEQMAPVSSTVLIEGESGTGKELVARALRALSPRRNKPFIAVNVGALPETLLESELFGHEKGAFTGAAERRLGRFELADEGTIFLDEIGEIPQATQVKLLRVLEEREFTRVGGTASIRVNVRVIAATNRPLREHVEEGAFRADLYYRLNVLSIYLPPLRERRSDIPLLVRRFIRDLSAQHDRPFPGISAEAMEMLVEYAWPGNVRELRNLVESMVVLSHGREIGPEDLPRQIRDGGNARLLPVRTGPVVQGTGAEGRELEFILRSLLELKLQVEELRRRLDDGREPGPRGAFIGEVVSPGRIVGEGALPVSAIGPRDETPPPNVVTIAPGTKMTEVERAVIEAALKETRGNRRKAADLLGIGERTLYRKIKEYRLPELEYSLD
ncbi:MAG TPA: sigma-54 dependent transcriptional regulator [Gemmatimonadaceae bacterium]|jgi:DNA-binding NtrC family response regulator|nr:sigma-54 dependent transcriptional regulator [Gemmatimonadaceae bacterium]